jgi:hypothetical protein
MDHTADEVAITDLIAKRFIARPGVMAVQSANGAYHPRERSFTRADLVNHIRGTESLGHYLVNEQGECKLFAFDLDLNKSGDIKEMNDNGDLIHRVLAPRDIWTQRAPADDFDYLKMLLKGVANALAISIKMNYGIDVGISYSGSKGVHVYGWTGLIKASEARSLAFDVLNTFELPDGKRHFVPTRGDNFFQSMQNNLYSVEVFPKQDAIAEGGFGNLMRLPLGKNLKGTRSFFLDYETPASTFAPMNAVRALQFANAATAAA